MAFKPKDSKQTTTPTVWEISEEKWRNREDQNFQLFRGLLHRSFKLILGKKYKKNPSVSQLFLVVKALLHNATAKLEKIQYENELIRSEILKNKAEERKTIAEAITIEKNNLLQNDSDNNPMLGDNAVVADEVQDKFRVLVDKKIIQISEIDDNTVIVVDSKHINRLNSDEFEQLFGDN